MPVTVSEVPVGAPRTVQCDRGGVVTTALDEDYDLLTRVDGIEIYRVEA